MAKYVAIVKLDPADTNSTGGVVEWIGFWEDNEVNDDTIIPQPYQNSSGVIQSGYKAITLSTVTDEDVAEAVLNPNGVKVGWILQDKTNILRDPNS
jgi:hypothetical protein